jgi:O-antigen/teichoic acid export membrane protein
MAETVSPIRPLSVAGDSAQRSVEVPAKASLFRISRNAIVYVVANGLQRGATVAIMPLLLSRLSPAEYGRFGLVLSIYALLPSFLCLGLHSAISRFYFDSSDPARRQQITGSLLVAHIVSTLGFAGLLDLVCSAFVPSLSSLPFHPVLRLTIWSSAAVAVFEAAMALWRSAEHAFRVGVAQVAAFLCTTGAIAFFLLPMKMGLVGVLWGLLVGQATVSLAVLFFVLREIPFAWEPRLLRDALWYCLPLLPHITVGWTLRASDRWILEHFRDSTELGKYFFTYQLCSVISLVMFSSNDAIVPRFLAAYRDDGAEGARRFHSRMFLIYCWVAVALAVAVIVLSPWAGPLLSRGKVVGTTAVTITLAAAMVASVLYVPFANALFALKATARLTMVTVTCSILDVLLNFVLVPRWGSFGAAVTMLVTYVVLLLCVSQLAHRRLGLDRQFVHLAGAAFVLAIVAFLSLR